MKLVEACLQAPDGLGVFLEELGEGENGFGGTDYATGKIGIHEYLQRIVDASEGRGLRPGHVSQSTYWLLDNAGSIVGMCRMRHALTPALIRKGGHIGYYISPSERGRGYGKDILAAVLNAAKQKGITNVLLTTDSINLPSVRTIEANGGRLEDELLDEEVGTRYRRYWIDLRE